MPMVVMYEVLVPLSRVQRDSDRMRAGQGRQGTGACVPVGVCGCADKGRVVRTVGPRGGPQARTVSTSSEGVQCGYWKPLD